MTQLHNFHIPVMGIGFSIDTPIKVAKFGIDSVISLASHEIIELMRKYYSNQRDEEYVEIKTGSEDAPARRITDYLNTVNEIVNEEFRKVQNQSFLDTENDLNKTFQMLAPSHPTRQAYDAFVSGGRNNPGIEEKLRSNLKKGSIDVNILTQMETPFLTGPDSIFNENMSALRGFANSDLESSIVLCAGINMPLYSYINKFKDFLPDENGKTKKKIIVKVSDYKSMATQGRFLARKGLWVAEYRIESGLNCGGHGFGSPNGSLSGPILNEIGQNKEALRSELLGLYRKALGNEEINPEPTKVSYQGGVKTSEELQWFLDNGADKVGVGTPFTFVPEVTNVGRDTLELLKKAGTSDIILSRSSPYGIPFSTLNETKGVVRHNENKYTDPGVICTYGHLKRKYTDENGVEKVACYSDKSTMDSELAKIADMQEGEKKDYLTENILAKYCLCTSLVLHLRDKYGIEENRFRNTSDEIICPGPSAAYFDDEYTLLQMARHLNGEESVMKLVPPHTVMEELRINVERIEVVWNDKEFADEPDKAMTVANNVINGLKTGIEFYRSNIHLFPGKQEAIKQELDSYEGRLSALQK